MTEDEDDFTLDLVQSCREKLNCLERESSRMEKMSQEKSTARAITDYLADFALFLQ